MMYKTKSLFANIAFGLLLAITVFLITPNTFSISKYKIPSSSIRFSETAQTYLMNDYIDPDIAQPFRKQFWPTQGSTPRRYNFNFDEKILSSSPQSLYIPSTTSGVTSLINGIPFEKSTDAALYASGFGQGWIINDVPRLMFTPLNNRVDLHYPKDEHRSGLRSVYIGPSQHIHRVAQQQRRWMSYLPKAGIIIAILSAFLCVNGLLFGKHKKSFAILGMVSIITFFQFIFSFLEISPNLKVLNFLLKGCLPISLLGLFTLWYFLPKRQDNIITIITPVLFGTACIGPIFGLLSMFAPFPMPAPLLGTSVTLTSMLPLVFFWPLTNLFHDLQERRSIVGALRSRVSEQEKMLDEKSRLIALEMKKRAILEERQRFTRDIHDGIGGQLLTLLLRIRAGKLNIDSVAGEIQNGINDLRLVVDSMDHTGDNLAMALTTFKARTTRQLESTDLSLEWNQTPDLEVPMTSTRDILNLYRFMQEAVTNVIRHAEAKNLTINIKDEKNIFTVSLLDDGVGMKTEAPDAGKGLNNLRQRAETLQGKVKFGTGLNGQGFGVYFTMDYRS